MSKKDYVNIIEMDKNSISDYMKDIEDETKKLISLITNNGSYYQNTNKQKIIDTRIENLRAEISKLQSIIEEQ